MKSEYNAGHHAGFIHAINCPDIPNGEKDWGYNVFFFHGEHYVAYALRSYPSIPDVGYVRFAASNGWVADWQKIASANIPEVHDLPLHSDYTNRGCKYFRTQEGIVSFAGGIYSPSGFIADAYFATLPEGFRPDHAIIVPALLYPSRSPVSLIIETNGAVRITVTSSDTYLYVQTTFATG